MRTVLIGHRGVGKTSLLKRIETYYAQAGRAVLCLDLDLAIRDHAGEELHAIFARQGEEAFRQLERDRFAAIDAETAGSKCDVFLALGAGFDPAAIPESWCALWVRRSTDEAGRIFTDRPRLNAQVSALEEFRERYQRRTAAYRARADQTLWLDEGGDTCGDTDAGGGDPAERAYFLGEFRDLDGAITLLPELFRSAASLERWAQTHAKWGVRWFELRDDLLSEEQMDAAARVLPDERILVSFRKADRRSATGQLIAKHGLAFDWPVELGACDVGEPRFLSFHQRLDGETLSNALAKFPTELPPGTQLKAALPVGNFDELMEGHAWRMAAPETRIFLPHSKDGRWAWYRLHVGHRQNQSLNFFREGEGTGADQPTLLQWARRARGTEFAAVLGDPVKHSRTPLEQREFFAARGAAVYAIRVLEAEMRTGALEHLRALGLRWAAVTSPLKEIAYSLCSVRDPVSEALGAVNTLQWQGRWVGCNTDIIGLAEAVASERVAFGATAVWGGGGTLNVIRKVLPDARYFSLRTRLDRDGGSAEFRPNCVVWAVGRSLADVNEPPASWRPAVVFDLNYSEDSPGRAFALRCGSRYISGIEMFRAQARAQREWWGGNVSPTPEV